MIEYSKLPEISGIERVIDLSPTKFILGDNMAFLRWCKDQMLFKHFHVGIVDPPYGINVGKMRLGQKAGDKERTYEMGDWDAEVPTKEYWYLLNYCCRNLIMWGGNYFTDMNGDFIIATVKDTKREIIVETLDFSLNQCIVNNVVYDFGKIDFKIVKGITPGRCALVWDKTAKHKLNEWSDKAMADFELATTTFDKNAKIIEKYRTARNIEDGNKIHPTQKPVYLYDYLHLNFVEKNQRVLDTHGGSHSHAIAAYKNNVDLTIIEMNKSYQDNGIENYKNLFNKPRLLF